MDITSDSNKRTVEVFPLWSKINVVIFTIASFVSGYYVNIWVGLLILCGVLLTIGFTTTNAWNKELRNDGYAAITHLYSGYISALFVVLSFAPAIYMLINNPISIIVAFVIGIFYASIISSIAFRGVDEYEQVIKTYEGPAVVYLPDGPYIEHNEIVANESKN